MAKILIKFDIAAARCNEQKNQNLSGAKFNQLDRWIWVTWPELTNQWRGFWVFAVVGAQQAETQNCCRWLVNFCHVTQIKKNKNFFFQIWKLFFLLFPSLRLLFLHVTSSSFQSPLPSSYLPFVVLISSIVSCDDDVFLSTLTFCCLHSIHSTYSPSCDDHQSNYLLFLSIDTYLLFSWLHPMHWSLSLVACLPHLCICILRLAFLHRSVWRSSSSLSCVSWGLSSIYFTLSESATTPTLVQRTTFGVIAVSWSVLTVIWACDLLHDGPAYYQLCKPDNFFFHLLCDLNQGSLPPKPITLPTVLARLRCWCEE